MRRQALTLLLALVAFIGFLEATYLSVQHYRGVVPPCTIVIGCDLVTTSSYALLFNIPVALLGALYYLAVLLLAVGYLESGNDTLLFLAVALTPIGFLASAYFMYLQLYIIKATCIYCVGSALSSTILFILGIITWRTKETLRERLYYWWRRVF